MRLIKSTILQITLLLLLLGVADCHAQHWDASIDPLDTLDELDLKALKDKIPMSRNNVADVVVKMSDFERRYGKKLTKKNFENKTGIVLDSVYKSATWPQLMGMVDSMKSQKTNMINTLDYALDDYYSPEHQTFLSSGWRNVYLGLGGAWEQFIPQGNGYEISPVTQVSAFIGKDFTMKHSVRLSIGGGWGLEDLTKYSIKRFSARADYLFNISSQFAGYNPSRRIGFSTIVGLGVHYTSMKDKKSRVVPDFHVGLQTRIYTGPRGYLNIEPYIGLASDPLDLSGTRNWKDYDAFWGVQMNYAYYLKEQLSPESKLRILSHRASSDRVIDAELIDSWRTPWFVEASSGLSLLKSDNIPMGKSKGSSISLSVGRWFSPVVGGRVTFFSRNTNYQYYTQEKTALNAARNISLPMRYAAFRFDMLFNPLGFSRKFAWDKNFGFHTVLGAGYGMLQQTLDDKSSMRTYSVSFDAGIHAWYKLSEDLQVFAEPLFTHNIYTMPYSNVNLRKKLTDNHLGVDIGLTMLIRSEKFHDLYEFDDVQKFNYRFQRGVRVGAAIGLLNLQREGLDYGGGSVNWSATAFAEYRFNFLHTVRGSMELLSLSHKGLFPCYESYIDDNAALVSTKSNRLTTVDSKMALFALLYQVNLTNLCSGVLKDRRFELEAFAGPAASLRLTRTAKVDPDESRTVATSIMSPVLRAKDKTLHFGANAGLKLTAYVWNGISVFFSPNIYVIRDVNPEVNTNTRLFGHNVETYQSFSLGVQYKCGKARFNPTTVRNLRKHYMENWRVKQDEKDASYQKRLKAKQDKRRKEYNEWLQKQKSKKKKTSKYIKIEVDADD